MRWEIEVKLGSAGHPPRGMVVLYEGKREIGRGVIERALLEKFVTGLVSKDEVISQTGVF